MHYDLFIEEAEINDQKVIRYPEYDFKHSRVSFGRNSIHDYPAMIHYKLVDSLISEFEKPNMNIYDPFCGSGTTLVQSLKKGYRVFGTDINPLALLIADVRCSNINKNEFNYYLNSLINNFYPLVPDIPKVTNINYWFKEQVILDLGRIRKFISVVPS